jgi:hypothetical protein
MGNNSTSDGELQHTGRVKINSGTEIGLSQKSGNIGILVSEYRNDPIFLTSSMFKLSSSYL